jgi:hypothetical protein
VLVVTEHGKKEVHGQILIFDGTRMKPYENQAGRDTVEPKGYRMAII